MWLIWGGVTKPISFVPLFFSFQVQVNFSPLLKHLLPIGYRVRFFFDRSDDTPWFKEAINHFAESKFSLTEKLTNETLVSPTQGFFK